MNLRYNTQQRVADAHHVNADPDPACHCNADPDPSFHCNADPDPAHYKREEILRPLVNRLYKAPLMSFTTIHGIILSLLSS
jgi:hypothetical protein